MRTDDALANGVMSPISTSAQRRATTSLTMLGRLSNRIGDGARLFGLEAGFGERAGDGVRVEHPILSDYTAAIEAPTRPRR